MVDIELADEEEDQIEDDDRVGSLESDEKSVISNPYLQQEGEQNGEQKTHTFIDYTNFSYFVDTMQQIQKKVVKKEKVQKETYEL